jgi:leader peptidase (prepilin peptidase)/N-methyltransferase
VPLFVDILLATFAFVFGLIFGSFLNVCIYRLPRGLSVVAPRSACPNCAQPIAAYDNIPVLSWILLGGKCRNCKTPITPRYMIVELICGLLFLACFLEFALWNPNHLFYTVPTNQGFSVLPLLQFVKYAVLSFLLLGLIFTDAETQLLPDKMTLSGLFIGLAFSVFVPMPPDILTSVFFDFVPVRIPAVYGATFFSVFSAVMGTLIGGGFIWSVGALWKLIRGYEGMGFGDVKLMAMVGAFLGTTSTLLVIFGASLLGSLLGLATIAVVYLKRRGRYIKSLGNEQGPVRARKAAFVAYRFLPMPFGVSLGTMALAAIFFSRFFFHWYLGIA